MAWSHLRARLLAVLLMLVTMTLYWPATRHDFVNFDDSVYVTANARVRSGLSLANIKWACVNPVCSNWHPVTVWSHMLDCQLYGLKPWGHHLTSVLLHAVNTALVFLLLRGLTGALWRSWLAAALWGWHPLRVESVAWVAERKDVLSGLFGLLALLAYARYAEKTAVRGQKPDVRGPGSLFHLPSSRFYLLSLFLFALGLMSKPMLVTWPFVMLLLDYWPLHRNAECTMQNAEPGVGGAAPGRALPWTKLVWEKVPFLVVAAAASVMTFIVQQRAGALAAVETVPLGARAGNALISYCRYVGKTFWPTDLAVYYPHPGYWPLGKVVLAGGLLLGLSALLWTERRRARFPLMGWLWFLGVLAPVIGLVQVGEQAMADRYTYLPSLGVLILLVWGVCELTRRWRYQVPGLSVAGGAALGLCLALTGLQIDYWQDGETLFRHALKVTENNYPANNNLSAAFYQKGQIDEAIRQYQEAIRLKPDQADSHNGLGAALAKKGQTDEAIRQFKEAIRLSPGHADAHNNLGFALASRGQTDEAIRLYKEALRFQPEHADAHNNLGIALFSKGQLEEAISQMQEALRLKPDYAEAHYNLGVALDMKGQTDEAIRQYQETLRLKPDDPEAHYNLGLALGVKGQIDQAISHFREAIRLKPEFFDAHYNLGFALAMKGHADEAIRHYQEALRLKPDCVPAHYQLGNALLNQGRADEAIFQFQEALRLKPDLAEARKSLDVARAAKAGASPSPSAATNR
jgi:tetratricopeptide (TPR) repeat protein